MPSLYLFLFVFSKRFKVNTNCLDLQSNHANVYFLTTSRKWMLINCLAKNIDPWCVGSDLWCVRSDLYTKRATTSALPRSRLKRLKPTRKNYFYKNTFSDASNFQNRFGASKLLTHQTWTRCHKQILAIAQLRFDEIQHCDWSKEIT